MSPTAPIISKVWSFCTTLRDDGVGYGDYLETCPSPTSWQRKLSRTWKQG